MILRIPALYLLFLIDIYPYSLSHGEYRLFPANAKEGDIAVEEERLLYVRFPAK